MAPLRHLGPARNSFLKAVVGYSASSHGASSLPPRPLPPMDSQLTLVDPTPPLSLVFSTNSMINATLSANGLARYTIITALQGSVTDLFDARTGQLLARIARNAIRADTISFVSTEGQETRVKLSKWMKRSKQPDGIDAHVIDTAVGQCFLRQHLEYRLALYTEFDPDSPVAHWASPDPAALASLPPTLVIAGSIPEAFHPQVICVFIIEELKMRMAEKADLVALGRAEAQSTPLARLR
ncbi:hypothetical protein MIND_01426900 [Mycena indigotica]|uniref:DUF6593 domain-containing protein n=1 Tax=Mycena indigotica TaxID=2126181 RepID=A0A8H6VSN6_9AGAR|nr:uncharacterized protein MIND_01426900 [Mycena indigotica]KAF7288603.1 hypothetical protein MIND_01426900 [Mycena indigotica]